MKSIILRVSAITAFLVSVPVRAQDDPPPPQAAESPAPKPAVPMAAADFGKPGQVVISSDFTAGFSFLTKGEVSQVILSPALDYFFSPHLSLGGQLLLDLQKQGKNQTTALGIGPRAGYSRPLANFFSVFARAGLLYRHESTEGTIVMLGVPGQVKTSDDVLTIFIDSPFLFHPIPHFFVGLGPKIAIDLFRGDSGANLIAEIGLASTVGGYFPW